MSPGMIGTHIWASSFFNITFGLSKGLFSLSTDIRVISPTSSAIFVKSTGWRGSAGGFFWALRCCCCVRSMMFVTRSRRRAAQPLIKPSCFCMGLPASEFRRAPMSPVMPWSGLRSSWESTATKADLRCSMSFNWTRSDKSCPMAITLTGAPLGPLLGTMVTANWRSPCGLVLASPPMGSTTSTTFETFFGPDADTAGGSFLSDSSSSPSCTTPF
mmetsp:Transcript_26458/g.76370  ORF Transcript_26458/g.76370 Transcript_26458/m.76370 type:complete len:215 (+) Transcript_26458:1885-2529(+)